MTSPRRALVLVDVQLEYFSGPLEIRFPPVDDSLAQIAVAIDAATAAGTPIVVVQHSEGESAPVFAPGAEAFALHPAVEQRRSPEWKHVTKHHSSVFADTDLLSWLRERSLDTVTLVGYMTNNCIMASAVEAEALGVAVEVLSDATGAISLVNAGGAVDAETVHRTLMAILQSNLAAVAPTSEWTAALQAGAAIAKDALPSSATAGADRFPA